MNRCHLASIKKVVHRTSADGEEVRCGVNRQQATSVAGERGVFVVDGHKGSPC